MAAVNLVSHARGHGWIGVDLDGTLAEHYWPEKGPYDPLKIGVPIPRMLALVKAWRAAGWEVRIMTARVSMSSHPLHSRVCEAIHNWCKEYVGEKLTLTACKDFSMVALFDDRAYHVWTDSGILCCRHANEFAMETTT